MNNAHPAHFFLGIDGGGTHCRARLCDSAGNVLANASAGSANAQLGAEVCYQAILEATHAALDLAKLPHDILSRTYAAFGLAGAVDTQSVKVITDYPHPFKALRVEADALAACLGAHSGRDGAILILGTGSCGFNKRGADIDVVGGWGFPLSDQGSGALLGFNALRSALQAADSIQRHTALSQALIARFDHAPDAVTNWARTARARDYAALVPLVLEHYHSGDTLALTLVEQSAEEVRELLRALRTKGAQRICLMGGYAQFIGDLIAPQFAKWLCPPQGDAMDGALAMAIDLHKELSHA
ncbi:MAG: BadF/BadG/BcrA/BcrD ATPase family protein [Pseudomonadales bacterium]